MKFKTIELKAYQYNDTIMLYFGKRDKELDLPIIKVKIFNKKSPLKIKIPHDISQAFKVKEQIKEEVKQTEYKGYMTEGTGQIAEVVDSKVQSFYSKPINWNGYARYIAYEYIYDVAYNRGIRRERKKKAKKSGLEQLTINDIRAIAQELELPIGKLDHAIMEIIARKQANK